MVALPQTYNPSEVEASAPAESVPAGEYKVQVISSELKETKAGNGSFIEMVYLITQGEHENYKIWDRFNVDNPNQQAVDIGLRQFKQLAEACGKPDCTDTEELHNKVFICTTGPQKNDPTRTEVKLRSPYSGASGGSTSKAPASSASTGTAKKKPSWA